MPSKAPNANAGISVSWEQLVRFIRQLSHDLRNDLNAAELQSAYLDEVITDPDIKAEIRRLREMLARMAGNLQKLSGRFAQPQPELIEYRSSELVEDIRAKIAREFGENGAAVRWEIEPGDGTLNVDPQLFQEALLELFANAFRYQGNAEAPLTVASKIDNDHFVLTLHERKTGFDASTQNWGREPLGNASPGHYGLGLNRARIIIEAQGGNLSAKYDPSDSILRTTIRLPLSGKAAGDALK
jgi:signal transduction histidine kinase